MIKIKRAKNRQYYFVVLAKNHKVILTSETYKSKAGVNKAIAATLKACRGVVTIIKDETQTT